MGIYVAVGCIVSYVLLDVVTTTVLYAHESQLSTFTEDALNFNILQSALDIWGTVLLRASLLLGASLGVTWNKVDGPQRVAKSTSLILLICLIVITYTLAKLLMLTEVRTLSISHQPWLLSLICWTCASSLGVMLLWRWLGKEPESESSSSGRGTRGREDTEKLVETVGEEEQELGSERKKEKDSSSGATLGRLLSYCKKDAELLSVAVLFLIISAVCEAFIPYYYGKAIDSIVVHQSMEYFAKPVIILAALALASSLAIGVRGGVFTLTFARLNLRLRNHLFRTLMRQEIAFFDENHTGDILSRLSADTTQVSDLISQNVNIFLRSVIKSVGFFIFMFGMSWKLTLVTIMGFPFIGLVSKLYGEYYKVALVGQEPVLFARTVEENITYGLTDVPREAVLQAATKANAHDFITTLPKGYETSVGEKGTQLSGGQKQRVAIARALIRNPRVLVLDEATSALDAESEHIVQQALNNVLRDHTVLVIAHRLSTVEKADNILVIDRGHVAEQGSHSELMASGGLYSKLVQRQVLGIETGEEDLHSPQNASWKSGGGQQWRGRSSSSSLSESECSVRY
ncbi:ATP-binding cassette sub-family B member 9 [Neolamprologus brichardi]|uniref:ATP-binding cassette sub-family B member 9 n=1 Tax=Neolamprologus brichardi TaxID=32507 RepID=UPI0003EC2EAB|nr:ATP-binding cassette sub-family B member 9 [Neolamprologus brichardi]